MVKPLSLTCPDFQDPFSLTEKPPAEFCLSPDGNSEAISIDLLQKKGLVKAVNTAVDLIVAHFGTSRDPGVKVGKKLWRAELYLLTLTFPVLPPRTQS